MKKSNTTELIEGKHFYGAAVVGERGQIVIPQDARVHFDIKAGDKLVIFGSLGKGIMLIKSDKLKKFAETLLKEL